MDVVVKEPPFTADDLAKSLQSDRELSSYERCERYIRTCLERTRESVFYTLELRRHGGDPLHRSNARIGALLRKDHWISFTGHKTGTTWIKHHTSFLDWGSLVDHMKTIAERCEVQTALLLFKSVYLTAVNLDFIPREK